MLIAYDGSESSANAIAVAKRLLREDEAVVCHVWAGLSRALFRADPATLPEPLQSAAREVDDADESAGEKLAEEGAELARAAGLDARALAVRERHATWRALLAAADEVDASVIVVGAQGLSGIGRVLLGSVSTAVLHRSRRPVLVVPASAAEDPGDGPPLLCYDGSEGASLAIEAAGGLLAPRTALVLRVWESWVAEAPALAGLSGNVMAMATELDERGERESAELASRGVAAAETAGFAARGLAERATGPLWRAVLDTAEEHRCAAIVVGSRGATGITAALGSVSNGVVHHSRRPVLVVPPRAEASPDRDARQP
jgi:nucleotide-binding universal stress UspA family protein